MKRKKTIILATALTVVLFFNGVVDSSKEAYAATERSNGKNMEKVLKYYKKGEYKKAQKYNKKLSKYAKEKCVKNMSGKMKRAYLKIVKSHNMDMRSGKKYISGYYLTDIDNDNVTELIIKNGSSEADNKFYVYDWKNEKAKKLGKVEAIHSEVYAYIGHKGFIAYGGVTQSERIRVITIKNGKLKVNTIAERNDAYPYFGLRCEVKSHYYYENNDFKMDYSDLK